MVKNSRKIFIISGMSGCGKTYALKVLENLGFYCIDNIPFSMFDSLMEFATNEKQLENVAIGLDIRIRKNLESIVSKIAELQKQGTIKLIFLNSEDKSLIKRFSETRLKHPLGENVLISIKKERKILRPIKHMADKVIDTSNLTLAELKERVTKILEVKKSQDMQITLMSFGFKHNVPLDADIVMDVRFIKNPYYIKEFKNKTGLDKSVRNYVLGFKQTIEFVNMFTKMVKKLIPSYIKEGKSYLTIAIGCTGGRHRSVTISKEIAKNLKKLGYNVNQFHRDSKK
ncbi:MAG: RNase adapter RapZ [Elusimicrobiaceae bacterium]|nr:RNase adapter RapZ [Elusimicrobiaceae bacterium]MBT3955161.1 RNase adapter RapZ [Elusimicrobiaceae bacterium]MBT4008686.1 RNase adapter RapZ [Elusimicrobiaceae bacterium]MBT4402484.1 RNase adapter RapZ [Elusimicrobiaceae bacterium]MBT4440152.1 RNase adapter RapZ [Elusimicrobiaceae bacterium]